MKLVPLAVCALVALSIAHLASAEELASATALIDETGLPSVLLEYEIRRAIAIDGGSEERLQAFLHAYNNQPELSLHMSEATQFLRSAAADHIDSQYMLGYALVGGDIKSKYESEGLSWLEKAADGGHKRASYWAGHTYASMYFRSSDQDLKLSLFERAERRLLGAIENKNDSSDEALAARLTLSRVYIAYSVLDDRGWAILIEAADFGYAPALKSLRRSKVFLEGQLAEGYAEAGPLLEQVTLYLDDADGDKAPQ